MCLPLLCGQRKLRQKSSLKRHIYSIEKFDTKSEFRAQTETSLTRPGFSDPPSMFKWP